MRAGPLTRGAAIAAAAIGLAGPLGAQPSPVLSGVVRDSAAGAGLQGAEVALAGGGARTITAQDGAFRLPLPVEGRTTIAVRRLGYRPRTVVVEGTQDRLDLTLASAAVSLAAVRVVAPRARYAGRLGGYYERLERRTNGVFITRAEIERARPPQLSDMLQRSPGVRVTRGRPGAQSIRMRGRECRPAIWLDGAPMSAADVDLDSFAPSSLEGVELYMGANAPPRYQMARGQSECGTLLLWSRGQDSEPRGIARSVSPEELEVLLGAMSIHRAEDVEVPARADPAAGWVVAYPPSMRAAKEGGMVVAEFVVDAEGRVEAQHFGIVSSTDAYLSAAVAEAAPAVRYEPARLRGRAVRQLVRQTFTFDPRGGS